MDPSNIGPNGAIYSRVIENNPCSPPPYGSHALSVMLKESTQRDSQGQAQAEALEPQQCYDLATSCAPPCYSLLFEDRIPNGLC